MADLALERLIHHCPCPVCQVQPTGTVALHHQAINRVMSELDEQQRRLFTGLLARQREHGGIRAVAEITGLSRTTVRRGLDELRSGTPTRAGRVRRVGGGRKRLEKNSRRW